MATVDQYESVLVISDTHVGLPDKEIFRQDLEGFIEFLANNSTLQVESEKGSFQFRVPKAIVLLGDFVDLWDGRLSRLPTFSTFYARLLTEIADIFYLRGNHDYIITDIEPKSTPVSKKFEIRDHKVLEIAGKQYFFIHGHQFMSAFGLTSLRIESYINPFYSTMESFLSRFFHEYGRPILQGLAIFDIALGLLITLGQTLTNQLPPRATPLFWLLFGLFLPLAIVTLWRTLQKTVWKFFVMVFGEVVKSLRGAVRGDTIKYLTSPSKPISRWFTGSEEAVEQARNTHFVCYGHTHIPGGPKAGTDGKLHDITFLNTGSWVKPPTEQRLNTATKIRGLTKAYDKIDEYLFVLFLALVVLAIVPFRIPALFLSPFIVVFTVLEVLVVFGKSSYRRLGLQGRGLRSLAFIGKDTQGVPRTELLYWDPQKRTLTTRPQLPDE
jgi:UDP-2,3-diacylglucosamine pyrophosphatase LpxH